MLKRRYFNCEEVESTKWNGCDIWEKCDWFFFFYLKLFSEEKGTYYATIMRSSLIVFYIQTTFNIFPFNAFNQISRVQ